MSARRPYLRPMSGWWRKNPWFVEYMVHEGTALFVAAYALILLASVYMLGNGEAAWNRWREFLVSPLSIVMHAVLMIAFLYHAWTWFKVMPKTLPFIRMGGWRVPDAAIIGIGVAAAVILSAALFAWVWGVVR